MKNFKDYIDKNKIQKERDEVYFNDMGGVSLWFSRSSNVIDLEEQIDDFFEYNDDANKILFAIGKKENIKFINFLKNKIINFIKENKDLKNKMKKIIIDYSDDIIADWFEGGADFTSLRNKVDNQIVLKAFQKIISENHKYIVDINNIGMLADD